MTPLTDLNGCGNLPQKLDTSLYACDDTGIEARHCAEHGNALIDQLSKCAVVFCEEEIARALHKFEQDDKHRHLRLEWDNPNLSKNYYRNKAKALCANPKRILRIERIKE